MPKSKIEILFTEEKATKNTIRFEEDLDLEGKPPKIKTLYLQNWVLKGLGNPKKIKVTIEPAEGE